jgi:hypothetical protein
MNSQADMGNTLETCWVGTDIGRIGGIIGFMGQPYPFILKIRATSQFHHKNRQIQQRIFSLACFASWRERRRGAEAATLKQVKAR